MSTKYRTHYDSATGAYNDSLIGECIWTSNNLREASPENLLNEAW